MPVLEDELGNAEGSRGGEQVGRGSEGRHQRGLQSDQQKQEAKRQDDAHHHWCPVRDS